MDLPWSAILQGIVTFTAIMLVNRWIGRSPMRARSRDGRLSQPRVVLGLGLVCFTLFASMLILSNLFPNETVTWFTNTVFAVFALLGLGLIIGYWTDRITYDDTSFTYPNLYGLRKTMVWSDVALVRYKPGFRWFLFEDSSGAKARPHIMHIGLPAFARVALTRVPATALDEATRALLTATALGEPPRPYG